MNTQQKRTMRKWIKALRSGEYVQGVGALKRAQENHPATYCCLGVLCEIQGVPSERNSHTYDFLVPWVSERKGHKRQGSLPTKRWFENETGLSGDEALRLASMNDALDVHSARHKNTFADIADYLETKIK